MEYRYKLEKYRGKVTRHVCPACNDKSSFVYYIDTETNTPIHQSVGKCNHESGCGYHYKPKHYFTDNDIQNEFKPIEAKLKEKPQPQPMGILSFDLVEKSASYQSNFVRFLCEIFDHYDSEHQIIKQLVERYALGVTKTKEVIFWQIDISGKVRTGKIMQYKPETGRRQHVDWIHSRMIKQKQLQDDYNLVQCFFGEHLLKLNPSGTVAIVESEKTAIIASGLLPEYIWIAAGQLQGLNIDKCRVLTGRNIILFPDLSEKKENRMTAFEVWSVKATEITKSYKCKVVVSDLLERNATENERKNGFDIADYLIKELINNATKSEIKYSETLQNMINSNNAVQILIDKLELEEIVIKDKCYSPKRL